jgi:folate-binding protein YgfZ
MTSPPPFNLDRRGVVRVHGADATSFLDRLLTADVTGLAPGAPTPAALLTPQGKILYEMMLHAETADGTSFALDLPIGGADDLASRLATFRLRADVAIEDVSEHEAVWVDETGMRRLGEPGDTPLEDELAAYDAWRVALGRPEQGVDYGSAEVFPTDVNLDLLGGVDYAKGCFVGQEVVSRMKRRGSIRKRTLIVTIEGDAPARGAAVMAGDATLGETMSSAGGNTLALIRLDRLAQADPAAITVEGRPAHVAFPDYMPEDARRGGAGDGS